MQLQGTVQIEAPRERVWAFECQKVDPACRCRHPRRHLRCYLPARPSQPGRDHAEQSGMDEVPLFGAGDQVAPLYLQEDPEAELREDAVQRLEIQRAAGRVLHPPDLRLGREGSTRQLVLGPADPGAGGPHEFGQLVGELAGTERQAEQR